VTQKRFWGKDISTFEMRENGFKLNVFEGRKGGKKDLFFTWKEGKRKELRRWHNRLREKKNPLAQEKGTGKGLVNLFPKKRKRE